MALDVCVQYTGCTEPLDEIGLPHSTGKSLSMTDIWTHKPATVRNAHVAWELEPYDCAVFRAKVVDRT